MSMFEGNSPNCPYCNGENIPGCYCVVRPSITLPENQDSHVRLFDMMYVGKRYRQAKQDGNLALQYAIKSGLNAFMLPFSELRRSLQSTEFGKPRL